MTKTLKEMIKETMTSELEIIRKELTPIFKEFGNLEIHHFGTCSYIRLNYHNNKDFDNIISLNNNGYYNTCFENVYNSTGIDANDIFEKIDDNLGIVNIKPYVPFDINQWKQEFANKYDNLLFYPRNGQIMTTGRHRGFVIDHVNNANYSYWHNDYLTGHEKFKFDNSYKEPVFLKTKKDCLEFEAVFESYINRRYPTLEELFPNLLKAEREQVDVKFAEIARILDIDSMHNDNYHGYNVTQQEADLILKLFKRGALI